MFERFTERARQIVVLAHMEARLLDDDEIAPRHILLGLAQEPGVLCSELEKAGPDLQRLRRVAEEGFQHLGRPRGGEGTPFAPQVQLLLRQASSIADEFANDRVSQDHIALATLRSSEEVRAMLGVRADAVEQAVDAELAANRGKSISDLDGL